MSDFTEVFNDCETTLSQKTFCSCQLLKNVVTSAAGGRAIVKEGGGVSSDREVATVSMPEWVEGLPVDEGLGGTSTRRSTRLKRDTRPLFRFRRTHS